MRIVLLLGVEKTELKNVNWKAIWNVVRLKTFGMGLEAGSIGNLAPRLVDF
jgi:hypothetical protein